MIFYYCEYKLGNEVRIYVSRRIRTILQDLREDSKYENYHIGILKVKNQVMISCLITSEGHSYLKSDILKRL